jgi:L-cysteine S-thiosulfotransferase
VKRTRRRIGTGRLRGKRLADRLATFLLLATSSAAAIAPAAKADALVPYTVVGDGIPESLTGKPGDAARGRALVLERASTCILCHSGPFPEARFQGDLAPNLAGTGGRWSTSQLRLRLVDASRLNPATIMPSYYRVEGLVRVGRNWGDKPILSAEQIEDIVAYLTTLRDQDAP